MTDLQLELIVVGALAIVGVYAYNRFQERKYRRDMENALPTQTRDVLLEKESEPRPAPVTPRKSVASNEAAAENGSHTNVEPTLGLDHSSAALVDGFDPEIDYVVDLACDKAFTGRQLKEALDKYRFSAKPVRWRGKLEGTNAWDEVSGPNKIYTDLQVGLQIANRKGPLAELDFASFLGMVKNVALDLGARTEFPNDGDPLERAQALDEFGSEVDLLIGLNVLSTDGAPMQATKIRALAEAEGMSLGADGVFHYKDESGERLFTLANHEARPFAPEHMKTMTTNGITFLLDVPRVREGSRVFEKMVSVARNFAHALHAIVVDDNRKPLLDPEVKRIRAHLDEIFKRMGERGIPAGSPTAARLFSE